MQNFCFFSDFCEFRLVLGGLDATQCVWELGPHSMQFNACYVLYYDLKYTSMQSLSWSEKAKLGLVRAA